MIWSFWCQLAWKMTGIESNGLNEINTENINWQLKLEINSVLKSQPRALKYPSLYTYVGNIITVRRMKVVIIKGSRQL